MDVVLLPWDDLEQEVRFEDSPRISWLRIGDSTEPVGPRKTDSKHTILSRHVAIISAWKRKIYR